MELDFIENINEFDENIVRLYNFDIIEAIAFKELIETVIIKNKQKLDLSTVSFIERRNCNLILGLFKSDEGIFTVDNTHFYCALTLEGYKDLVKKIQPFCKNKTNGYQYLYDIDTPIDFLFAPIGVW